MPAWKKILIGVGFFWAVGAGLGLVFSSGDSGLPATATAAANNQPVQSKDKEPTIGELVIIKKQSWRLDGFNTVFVADLTIENKNKLNLKDFVVECETIGGSGTSLNKVRKTVYELLPAGKTKTFKNINMGFVSAQSKKAGCEIIGALPEGYK